MSSFVVPPVMRTRLGARRLAPSLALVGSYTGGLIRRPREPSISRLSIWSTLGHLLPAARIWGQPMSIIDPGGP